MCVFVGLILILVQQTGRLDMYDGVLDILRTYQTGPIRRSTYK